MPADFSVYSHFDKNAAFSNVKYAADAHMLEVEFNELQQILDNKLSTLIKDKFGDGFYKTGTLTYNAGSVSLSNEKAFANGHIIEISSLTLALAEGETAYLDVWEQELAYGDVIKKFGNQQEANVLTNYIKDSRETEETTKRTQVQYNLVKATGVAGHTYLPLGEVSGGSLVDSREEIAVIGSSGSGSVSKQYSSFTAVADNTTHCLINNPNFNQATDVLDVYYQGGKQTPGLNYNLDVAGDAIDLTFSILTGEVINFEILKNMAISETTGMAVAYFKNSVTTSGVHGTVLVGISQFNPDTDLLIVTQNTVTCSDFTVTGTGASATIVKNSGTWEDDTTFHFLVIKNIVQGVVSYDGALLTAGSVTGTSLAAGSVTTDKLSDELQNRLDVNTSIYRSMKDANGIFQRFEKKRHDGTLFSRSNLTGGTSPAYTTRTETFYDLDGITSLLVKIYTLTYDGDGDFVSEVVT